MSFLTKDISSSSSSSSSSSCLVAMCIVDGDLPHATPEHKSIGGGGGQMDGRHRLQTSSPLPPLFYTIGSSIADRKSQHFYPLGWSGWWSFIKLHLKQLSDNHRLRISIVGHFPISLVFSLPVLPLLKNSMKVFRCIIILFWLVLLQPERGL